jgi:serine phosphatase RsbU (regulator of sigma subunit)
MQKKSIFIISLLSTYLFIQTTSYTQISNRANDFRFQLKAAKNYLDNKIDSALYYTEIIIKNQVASDSAKGYAYLYKGSALHTLSKYREEKECYSRALKHFQKTQIIEGIAKVNMLLGRLHSKLLDYEKAIKYYFEAKKIYERLNDIDNIYNVQQNIGVMYFEKGELKRAKEYLLNVLKYQSKSNKLDDKASAYTNIAGIYIAEKKYDSCLYYFKLSLKYSLSGNNIDHIAVTYNNIGHIYNMIKKPDSAIYYFKKSIEYYTKIDNYAGISVANSGIANTYFMLKNYKMAEEHYKIALSIAEKYNIRKFAYSQYKQVSKFYAHLKNYEKAYLLLNSYLELKDSVENENKNRLLEEMQAKYDYEKQEKEIALLKEQQILKDERTKQEKQKNKILFAALVGIITFSGISVFFIWRAYKIKKETNAKLTLQNIEISQQHKEIKDSIKYAKRIQEAILPPVEQINKLLPENFILYKPKDIVSGDFYWVEEKNDIVYFAVVDCTGHGVPGAFMSIVGRNGLNEAINTLNNPNPAEILDYLNFFVNQSLHQTYEHSTIRDGMDLTLCAYNKNNHSLQFAGANNSLWQIKNKNGEFIEIKADKQPIGNYVGFNTKPFTNHVVQFEQNDCFYLMSDGFADQFGGPKGKKYKYSRLKELIASAYHKNMNEQLALLSEEFEKWKGNIEQVDDVCIMGIKLA